MHRRYRTGDQMYVRQLNLSTLLRYLHEGAPLSRTRLADLSGLNKTTVSSLVDELLQRGLIVELGQDNSAGGRPATILDVNPNAGALVGVQFGVDFIAVSLTDFSGRVLWRCHQEQDPAMGQESAIARSLQLVDDACAAASQRGARLLGLGVATPGTVNIEEGLLIFSPNLQWRNVPLRQIFRDHTGLAVFVDNDANAAAVGEHLFGVARQVHDFVLVFAGVGVGGGLFLRGGLYRGANGFAGEIGHTNFMLESYRPPCRCGNRGCWETYANQYSVIERVRARLALRRNSLIPRLMEEQGSPLTLSIVVQAAEAQDADALESLADAGSALGLGIANLISIFNPEMVVLGGPLSRAGPFLLPGIQAVVEKTVLPEVRREVRILQSAFPDSSEIGAVALVVDAILTDPTRVDRLPK